MKKSNKLFKNILNNVKTKGNGEINMAKHNYILRIVLVGELKVSFLLIPQLCLTINESKIDFSHIPTHTRSSDPYVSSLSEKSVPHRYPCEISVTNTR